MLKYNVLFLGKDGDIDRDIDHCLIAVLMAMLMMMLNSDSKLSNLDTDQLISSWSRPSPFIRRPP